LTGTIAAWSLVHALRNGIASVNAEAQRSLAKGAGKETTRELIDSDRVHATTRMKEIITFYSRVMRNVEQNNTTEGFFGAVQLVVPESFDGAHLDELQVTDQERSRNYSLGTYVDTLKSSGLKAGTLTLDENLGAVALHIGDGQGRLVGFHSMDRKIQN